MCVKNDVTVFLHFRVPFWRLVWIATFHFSVYKRKKKRAPALWKRFVSLRHCSCCYLKLMIRKQKGAKAAHNNVCEFLYSVIGFGSLPLAMNSFRLRMFWLPDSVFWFQFSLSFIFGSSFVSLSSFLSFHLSFLSLSFPSFLRRFFFTHWFSLFFFFFVSFFYFFCLSLSSIFFLSLFRFSLFYLFLTFLHFCLSFILFFFSLLSFISTVHE